jgi:hypothetical protein
VIPPVISSVRIAGYPLTFGGREGMVGGRGAASEEQLTVHDTFFQEAAEPFCPGPVRLAKHDWDLVSADRKAAKLPCVGLPGAGMDTGAAVTTSTSRTPIGSPLSTRALRSPAVMTTDPRP